VTHQGRPQGKTPLDRVVNDKLNELMAEGFDGLLRLLGRGYIYETIVQEGRRYNVGYCVSRPPDKDGIYTKEGQGPLKPGETLSNLEVLGYVEPVSFFPSFFRKEITFKTVVTKTDLSPPLP